MKASITDTNTFDSSVCIFFLNMFHMETNQITISVVKWDANSISRCTTKNRMQIAENMTSYKNKVPECVCRCLVVKHFFQMKLTYAITSTAPRLKRQFKGGGNLSHTVHCKCSHFVKHFPPTAFPLRQLFSSAAVTSITGLWWVISELYTGKHLWCLDVEWILVILVS